MKKMRDVTSWSALALLVARLISAQQTITTLTISAGTSYFPTNPWTIPTTTASCVAGATVGAVQAYNSPAVGGTFQDINGNYWEIQCGYDFNGPTYWGGEVGGVGTFGQGLYACFQGCAKRPGCIGFTFYGYSYTKTTGTGRCW